MQAIVVKKNINTSEPVYDKICLLIKPTTHISVSVYLVGLFHFYTQTHITLFAVEEILTSTNPGKKTFELFESWKGKDMGALDPLVK